MSDFTPKTFFKLNEADEYDHYPYILKGKTNSRKKLWKTHMFAETKDEMIKVLGNLMDDTFIGDQGVVFRQYENMV